MRFQVFNDGRAADKLDLNGAYMFGTDGIAIRRAQISFKGGVIECALQNEQTAALALPWTVKGFGRVLLPTTCLPSARSRPYNLNVELARAKLMQIVNRREDWTYFNRVSDLGEIPPDALELFVKAIENIGDAPTASKLADESLRKTIAFSGKLAVKHAETLLAARQGNQPLGRGCIGCRMEPSRVGEKDYIERIIEQFGFVIIPVNWAQVESQRGAYDFSGIDACVKALSGRKILLGLGPLLCFSPQNLPKWVMEQGAGFERIRETAYQFVSEIVSRYVDSVRIYSAIGGINAFNHLGFGYEHVLEMTRAACMAVKAASDRAVKIVELSSPWGQYYACGSNTLPPLVYIDMVLQSGINFDAFAMQLCFETDGSGEYPRDMMQVSAMLDWFFPTAKPLYITAVEFPMVSADQGDGLRQDRCVEQFYKIALSKPFVNAVVYGNLADDPGKITGSGLLTEKFQPKPAFLALKKISSVFQKRQTASKL